MNHCKKLEQSIRVEINSGSKKFDQIVDRCVPDDVFEHFKHLPRLKRVEPYVDGFSICTFDSKMNFE